MSNGQVPKEPEQIPPLWMMDLTFFVLIVLAAACVLWWICG